MCEYQLQQPIFTGRFAETPTVILPDDNFTFFGFHAKINEKIEILETGTFNQEKNKMDEDKKWTVDIKNIPLIDGDTVYYWIHVIRNGEEYYKTGSWTMEQIPLVSIMGSYDTLSDIYIENYDKIEASSTRIPTSALKVEADT